MVKTRRSNGENGEIEERNYIENDIEKQHVSNWSQRELRSGQYRVTRKLQHWPARSISRRLRTIKMPRDFLTESDTDPEKYSRRSRQMRVFFAGDTEATNRSHRIRRSRGPPKNYIEDSEDKPIQQNVRRSCRKRKLLHHSFNESWITNELKVRGYPGGLYGLQGSSTSDESSSGEEAQTSVTSKRLTRTSNGPTNTDEDLQSSQQRRTSTRCIKKPSGATDSESDGEHHKTIIEKKPNALDSQGDENAMDIDHQVKDIKSETEPVVPDSESNQGPIRSTRSTRARKPKKANHSQQESTSDSESSDSGSDLVINRQPRRSNRTRKPKPAFVEIEPRQPRNRAKTFNRIRKKTYSLRERKPKILRRKTISSSSTSSSDSEEDLNVSVKNKTKGRQKSKAMGETQERALREIQPVEVDGSVTFLSVGGLEDHIRCLREMVLFPLMYPDLFQKFKTRPAKGVLFHGPPGTGKTLLARALANECCKVGGRKVAFFMRKGADCLKKWVGESERHLKLLFQQAKKMKPSIIFFDEIDALAPVRSVRQEQVHTSVVGTLLAEMDGLCDRGEVVVIGATNRLDAVDPALRRAGRFDRELFFPPPHTGARRDILTIHTKDWDAKPKEEMLDHIAQLTNGYGGSDLKALCSESVLKALRRVYPQVYECEHALVIDAKNVQVSLNDMMEAMSSLVAAGARSGPMPARPLPCYIVPLLKSQVDVTEQLLRKVYVSPEQKRKSESAMSSSALLLTGPCVETYIAPDLLARLEHCTIKELSMATLHSTLAFTQEQALISVFSECRRADRGCVLFIRDAPALWATLGTQGSTLLVQLWRARAAGDDTLLLATSKDEHSDLPQDLQELFPLYKACTYRVREPTVSEIISFLKPVIVEAPLKPPDIVKKQTHPQLPRAPPPPLPRESAEEVARRKRKEDYKLRELRIFLRDICRKLASNRRFYKFTKPVDLEEVTDYLDIIQQPMDLESMMTKVDMHKYNCAKEFLDDIDLICANALEYNPDRTSSDKQIRHEACSLRDHAHALIEVEMDSDFELECQDIARRRQAEGTKSDADLPDFIYTASTLRASLLSVDGDAKASTSMTPVTEKSLTTNGIKRKRRRKWSKGHLLKRPRTVQKTCNKEQHGVFITDEESKENKPITSTPIPNGDVAHASASSDEDSMSDDDNTPLRQKISHDDSELIFNVTSQTVLKPGVLENPTKSSTSMKTSPKKRTSGPDSSIDNEAVTINKTDLENILYKNVKLLRSIGLEALIDLHCQINVVVQSYSKCQDRTKLPQEIHTIVNRYINELAKK